MRRLFLATLAVLAASCSEQDFVTDVPLRVVAITPTGGSVGAAREASITLTFSESLVADSVPAALAFESLGLPDQPTDPVPVETEISYADAPVPTVTLKPKAKLPFSTVFRVTVGSTLLRARDRGPLPVTVRSSFQTVHPPALRVERVEPADGAGEVARDAAVRVTFSEPVDCATVAGNVVLHELFDPHRHTAEGGERQVLGSWDCPVVEAQADATLDGTQCLADASRCTLRFVPEEPGFLFRYSSHLTLTLKGGPAEAKPLASARATPYGGQLPVTITSDWHIVNPAGLAVSASAPGAEAGQVARDATLTLTFSEPLDCATLSVVTVKQTFDAHPRLGQRAGTTADVPGSWACRDTAELERSPTACATNPELCRAVFTPEAGFLFEWSSQVVVALAGGSLEPNAAPGQIDRVESARATTHGGQLPAPVTVSFHVADPPALAVVAVSPGNGATGVARSPVLTLAFSEPPDCASLNDLQVVAVAAQADPHPRVQQVSGPLAGHWVCPPAAPGSYACATGANDPCVATFQADAGQLPLEWSTGVTLALRGGVYDAARRVVESTRATTLGGQLPTDVASAWRVVDPPALSLVASSPAQGSTGVSRSPVVRLTFSEPPRCALLSDELIVSAESTLDTHPRLSGQPSPKALAGTWSCPPPDGQSPYACATGPSDPCTATFTPDASALPLEPSTRVILRLAGGDYADGVSLAASTFVESGRATTRGGELPATTLVEFRVEDPRPQLVTRTEPGLGSFGVPVVAADVEVVLSEPVACATATSTTVTSSVELADGSAGTYAFNVVCTPGGRTIVLRPADPALDFPYSAQFTVRLAGGVFGEGVPAPYPGDGIESAEATTRGGQLAADYTFGFRTEDPPPLLVKAMTPSGGAEGVSASASIDVEFSEALLCASATPSTFQVVERFATPEDPARQAAAPASVVCSFTCPLASNAAAVSCGHAPFARSSVVEVTLQGGPDAAGSLRSQVATVAGGFLEAPAVTASFRVADPGPLTVVATTPNGNPGNHVSARTDVRFTFDRAVRCATAVSRISLFDETAGAPVPGAVLCSDGVAVGAEVAGNLVVFTPAAPLAVTHLYRATASAGIVAADATHVGTSVFGQLPADVTTRFEVAHEELLIVATTPKGGASLAPIGTNLTLQFNQELAVSSLVPCTATKRTACNVWINEGTTADLSRSINLAFVGYADKTLVLDPSDPVSPPNLQADKTYTVQVLGGLNGPVGANGVSRLPTDYLWTFTASSNALIVSVTPERDATGVDASAPVCVEFVEPVRVASLTAGGIGQIALQYVDAFGRTAKLPLDPATPYLIGDKSGLTGNYVCLNLASAPTPCLPGVRRLLYGADYQVTVSTLVEVGAAARRLTAPYSWSFETRLPPQVSEVRVKNAVLDEVLTDGASEVPVNAAFAVYFAEPMAPASLTAASIRVVAEGSSVPVTAAISPAGADARLALVTLSPAMSFLDVAADRGRYALVLQGGAGGLTTAAGNYLADDVRITFRTSPATRLVLSPPESQITPMVYIPVAALGRDLHLPSVNSQTVVATRRVSGVDVPIPGIVALQVAQPRAATFVANPTWQDSLSTPSYRVQTTTGVLDFRGNPVAAAASPLYSTGNTPAAQAIVGSLATYTNVSPTANAAGTNPTANGAQVFTLTIPYLTNLRSRVLGTSYYATAPGEPDGTISLEALGGAGCPAAGTRLRLRVQHEPVEASQPSTTPDRVTIEVAGPPYVKRGCPYALKIRQAQTANVYNQSAETTSCGGASPPTDIISASTCSSGSPSPGLRYVGETTPPTLVSLQVQRLDGSLMPAAGASGVFGGTRVQATFSEPIDPASVSAATFGLSGGISGTYEVAGSVVTLWPAGHLLASTGYTLTLGGLTDLAGNPFAGTSAGFTVESVLPTFDAVSFDSAATRDAPYGVATLTFSEPIDPATLTVNALAGPGSVSTSSGASPLYGCASRDPSDARRILWRPAASLVVGVPVQVMVNLPASSTVLADLAGTPVGSKTLAFTP